MIQAVRQTGYQHRSQNSPLYLRRDEVRQLGQMYVQVILALYGGGVTCASSANSLLISEL